MAFFTSSEQRERSERFDKLVENTDHVLRLPETKRKLGRLARQLRVINAQAFLPNKRSGQFRVPLQYQRAPYTAMIPVSDEEAQDANYLVAPILDQKPLSWRASSIVESKPYQINADMSEILAFPPTPVKTTGGLSEASLGRTMAYILPSKNKRRIEVSRPAQVIRNQVASMDIWSQAAVMAHEDVHALDVINDGPLFFYEMYGVSSEVRGYHVTHALSERSVSMKEHANVFAVETLRRRYATPKRPFAYSAELASALKASPDVMI